MKKINYIFIVALAIAACTTSLYAHHYRVSNIPGASAQYTSVQTAHDAALVIPGDTLYIEPSGSSYGNFNWSKQLVIIGNGYFLAANPETQANTAASRFENIYISSGASSSFITGCEINRITLLNDVHNIFIKRNRLIFGVVPDIGAVATNIYIIQNYVNNIYFASNSYANFTNISIENNIISYLNLESPNSATIINNVITGTINVTDCTLANNINTCSTQCSGYLTNCNVHNNIGASEQFGTDNGNLSNVNMADVFVCWPNCPTYSADGRYQLKPGSVATGAGAGGIDCGIFDGNYPYVLSGIPTVPAIYYLQVLPQGDFLNVSVKVKSHN